MIMRIKSSDFSVFAGLKYDCTENETLDKYINVFKENPDFCFFQVEDETGDMAFDLVCYICEKLKDCKMFTRVDRDDDGKIMSYWLCFAKNREE